MFYSALLYIIVAVVSSQFVGRTLHNENGKIRFIGIVIGSLLLGFVAGMRGYAGTDTINYIAMYQNDDLYFVRNDIEIGYKILMFLCHYVGMTVEFFLGFVGFITSMTILKVIDNNRNYINTKVACFIFVLTMYYLSFNIVRQGLAIAFTLYSLDSFFRKHYIKTIVFWLLALSMHLAAIITACVFLSYIIFVKKLYKYVAFICGLVLFYILFNPNSIVSFLNLFRYSKYFSVLATNRYLKYFYGISSGYDIHALGVQILRNGIVIAICLFGVKKYKCNIMYLSMFYFMIAGYIISLLGVVTGTQVERLGYYFSYYNILLLGCVADNDVKISRFRFKNNIVRFVIYTVFIIMFIYIRVYRNYAGLIPYGSF